MTIPEPTEEILSYDLQKRYELLKKCGGATGYTADLVRRCHHAERECDRLRAKLHDSDRIGTHYEGCWDSGPRHYGCAIAEITKLRARVAELKTAKGVAGE